VPCFFIAIYEDFLRKAGNKFAKHVYYSKYLYGDWKAFDEVTDETRI
jgi:hypothetical protein